MGVDDKIALPAHKISHGWDWDGPEDGSGAALLRPSRSGIVDVGSI